jgi:hypothetical protein
MRRAEPPVRFDDSVITLLGLAASADGPAVDAHFCNLLDLLAQNKASTRGAARVSIMERLHQMRDIVSPAAQHRAIQHLSRMPVAMSPDIARFLVLMTDGTDRIWLDHIRFTQQSWSRILPKLAMHEVRRIAGRNDLPAAIALQLGGIRPMPLMLPAPPHVEDPTDVLELAEKAPDEILETAPAQTTAANDHEPVADQANDVNQVKNILQRIASFRKIPVDAPDMDVPPLLENDILEASALPINATDTMFILDNPLPPIETPPEAETTDTRANPLPALLADWFWEVDRHGRFIFAGENAHDKNSAEPALPNLKGQYLLDWLADSPQQGKVDLALQRRSAFHHVPLHVADGALSGQWLLSAVAAFDLKSGVFLGHRGVAQRAPQRIAAPATSVPDALATVAHETRTPLNAIMGFAQMIEAQSFGPVSPAYTAQADAILDASSRLLRALDDVSEASKLDRGQLAARNYEQGIGFNLESMLETLFEQLQASAERRAISFDLRLTPGLPSLWSDRDIVERCINRLAIALMSVATPGEIISLSVRNGKSDEISLAFTRPLRLHGVDDAELMKPVQVATDETPQLNIGFALRLVERLAAIVGGQLRLSKSRISLLLPAVSALAQPRDAATV